MAFPVVRLEGTPYEQGIRHGEELREGIAHNVEVYFQRFAREAELPRDVVLERSRAYGDAILRQNPDYHDGMRGVADGSGLTLDEIAALNVRFELLYHQFGVIESRKAAVPEADGCTAFAVLPEASDNGHLLLGQNWDWIPHVRGAVLHTRDADGLETLAFTEAGIVGAKIGMNSDGLGLCVNGMTSMDDDWARLAKPYHVRCYEVLRSRSFGDALAVLEERPRACSTNYLVARAPDEVADLEAAPNAERRLACEGGTLVHTNHFLDPGAMGVTEAPNPRRPYSRHRLSRLAELMAARGKVSVDSLREDLTDHEKNPFGVCRHEAWDEPPEQHYITVTSVIMDLHDRTMLISDGPPCQSPYEELGLT